MTSTTKLNTFRSRARSALTDHVLRHALLKATRTALLKRQETLGSDSLFQILRQQARNIRLNVIERLDHYVQSFASRAAENGVHVYFCQSPQAANETVVKILNQRNAQKVVKSKSMVAEEIDLFEYLKELGLRIVETDLGEFIVTLAGEKPSHITAPAIHKTRSQVGKLFHEKLGESYTDDPQQLSAIAREYLRTAFLEAQIGITGANFALADTGSIVLFTNEGNGRMCTVLPPIHIVVMSLEKVIPSINDLDVFMRLLPASATGQSLTTYLSIINGSLVDDGMPVDREMHIIILDNGRSAIAQTDYRDILTCIRCGACMNVCPVYASVGGHAYDSTYVGPMGIVLTNLLFGMKNHHELTEACTLCRACDEVCPVAIPISSLIAHLRSERVLSGLVPKFETICMSLIANVFQSPLAYKFSQRAFQILFSSGFGGKRHGSFWARVPSTKGLPFHKRFKP